MSSIEANRKSLPLEARLDDAGTELPHAHVLGARQNRVVFSSNTVGEIVTGLFELPVTSFLTAFRYKHYFKTGSVAATRPVTMTLTKGSLPGGALVFTKTMPASGKKYLVTSSRLVAGLAIFTLRPSCQRRRLGSIRAIQLRLAVTFTLSIRPMAIFKFMT